MSADPLDRRRGRRVELVAPLLIRRTAGPGPAGALSTKNISLGGVYFEANEADAYAVDETVVATISIPEPQTRDFPFRRLSGRGRVVRVNRLAGQGADGRGHVGVALEFAKDVTRLTTIPARNY